MKLITGKARPCGESEGARLPIRLIKTGAFAALCLLCDGLSGNVRAQGNNPLNIDVRRSLAITDLELLEGFPLARTMDQLAAMSGVPGLTGIDIFRQWWKTQLEAPVPGDGLPHCDDEMIGGVSSINGYPYDCRPSPHEGRHASCSSFDDPDCSYVPIGLFNRFDLASPDGALCGEYRIIYAKVNDPPVNTDRNLLIFEGAVPNPNPQDALQGCRPLLEQWANLSQIQSKKARATLLEKLYFDGFGQAIPAIVQPAHYGDNPQGWGQIRTNQFMGFTEVTPRVWTLREFKLQSECGEGGCSLTVVPVPDAVNAFGPLFAEGSPLPQKAAFDAFFPTQVATLAADSIAGIAMQDDQAFDSAQSHSSGSSEMRYNEHFGPGALHTAISAELTPLGLENVLTPEQIVARAQAMTCAGCHQLSNGADLGDNLIWPASLRFTHVTELETETVNGSARYLISDALIQAFLPHRKQIMEDFLTGVPLPQVPPGLPIGGRPVH